MLILRYPSSCALARYLDFDYAIDLYARQSMMGYAFIIDNYLVSWKATLQPIVTFSTIEAKDMALVEATKEAIWLKPLISNNQFT